jgi:cytochrome c
MSKSKPYPRVPMLLAFLALPFLASRAEAKFATPDCPDVKESEFRYSKLVTIGNDTSLNEPLKMAFDLRDDNKVDVYFIERHGRVKRWNAASNTITLLASLDTYTDSPDKKDSVGETENGLEGIALDPDFKNNHWIYLRYEPWTKSTYRVSRFEVKGDAIDMASEKILLDVPFVREHTHLQAIVLGGAGMTFDSHGDLYIAFGANSELSPSVNESYRDFSAEYTSSNMASLKGAILRIHPDNSAKGYSIPKGNFGEYYSDYFGKQGQASVAAQYADTAKVKPEIYIKGVRNPYSLNVDPLKGWVMWGEFGPNRMGVTRIEEDNLATHPAYGGYPYWSGKHEFLLDGKEPWTSAKMDHGAPINASKWNEGPKELPPADTPRYAYSAYLNNGFIVGNHPTAGPIYRYDGKSTSGIKLPPHFDGAWFVTDRMNGVRVFQLSEDGTLLLDSMMLMTSQKLERPLDLQAGPDGALYVVDYGPGWHSTSGSTSIGRIEYTGSCHPGVPTSIASSRRGKADLRARVSSLAVEVDEPGPHIVRIHDFGGRVIRTLRGEGPMSHPLPQGRGESRKGVFFVTVEASKSTRTFTITDL